MKDAKASYEQSKNKYVEKDRRISELQCKLNYTQKSLKILNSRTSKLDHIFTLGKHGCNREGHSFQDEKSLTSKIVLVKSSHIEPLQPNLSQGNVSNTHPRDSKGKIKKFVSTCHFCNIKGHI